MFTKVSTTIPIKMNYHQVSTGMLYTTSPLTTNAFCHTSPNPQNHFNATWREGSKQHLGIRIKIFVFDSKALMMPFDGTLWDILVNYKNKRKFYELQVVEIVGHKVNHTQSYG